MAVKTYTKLLVMLQLLFDQLTIRLDAAFIVDKLSASLTTAWLILEDCIPYFLSANTLNFSCSHYSNTKQY